MRVGHRLQRRRGDPAWIPVVCALAVSLSSSAVAQPSAANTERAEFSDYQTAIDRGLRAFAGERFGEARAEFARAHAVRPTARTLRGLGVTDLALDHYSEAWRELEAALRETVHPLTPEQRHQVEELLTWMRTSLRRVELEYTPAVANARIDGRPVTPGEILLSPGAHRLIVSAPGYRGHDQTFQLALAPEPLRVRVQLTAAVSVPPEAVAGDDTWLWLGAGGAGLIVAGGVMFGVGRLQVDDVEDLEHAQSAREAEAARSRGFWLTTLGSTAFVAGVGGVVAAVIVRATERPERRDVAWRYGIGPGQVTVSRNF